MNRAYNTGLVFTLPGKVSKLNIRSSSKGNNSNDTDSTVYAMRGMIIVKRRALNWPGLEADIRARCFIVILIGK